MIAFPYIVLFLIALVGIPVGLGLLFYFVPKRMGYPKTGQYLTLGYVAFLIVIVLLYDFQDIFYTKCDALKAVQEQGFVLKDKFVLSNNESQSSLHDYYHTFTLNISANDHARAIAQITDQKDYKKLGEPWTDIRLGLCDRYFGPTRILCYESNYCYVRESLKPSGVKGYAPTYIRISISKKENTLQFEDIDD